MWPPRAVCWRAALTFPGGPHLVPGARRLQKCPGQADAHSPSEPCLNTKSLQFLPSYRKKGCSVLAGCGVALGAGQGSVPPSEGRPLAHRADTPQKSRCCKRRIQAPAGAVSCQRPGRIAWSLAGFLPGTVDWAVCREARSVEATVRHTGKG